MDEALAVRSEEDDGGTLEIAEIDGDTLSLRFHTFLHLRTCLSDRIRFVQKCAFVTVSSIAPYT